MVAVILADFIAAGVDDAELIFVLLRVGIVDVDADVQIPLRARYFCGRRMVP